MVKKSSIYVMFINKDKNRNKFIINDVMGRKSISMLPQTQRILIMLGENIRLARLRRKLPVELVAERAGVSRASVWAVEKGSPSAAIGIYAQVLMAVGLEKDLLSVAADDELGRKLQDAGLPTRRRAPKREGNE